MEFDAGRLGVEENGDNPGKVELQFQQFFLDFGQNIPKKCANGLEFSTQQAEVSISQVYLVYLDFEF